MQRAILTTFLLILVFSSLLHAQAQEEEPLSAEIHIPLAGEALQGNVAIEATTAIGGMEAWSLSFAYRDDTTNTWFLIAEGTLAVVEDVIAQWNTNTITDGIYGLKLSIDLDNGEVINLIVPDIRIRNYSPIETSTPTITPTKDPASDTATPTLTITPYPPTPTPLPNNPVEISSTDISNNLIYGVIVTLVLFLLLGLYTSIRRTLR
jgi:hypothetical protein